MPDAESPIPATADEPKRQSRRRLGMALEFVGLGGVLPALTVTVFVDEWRIAAAIAFVCFWLVWFVGKTLVKVNRS